VIVIYLGQGAAQTASDWSMSWSDGSVLEWPCFGPNNWGKLKGLQLAQGPLKYKEILFCHLRKMESNVLERCVMVEGTIVNIYRLTMAYQNYGKTLGRTIQFI